MTWLSQSDTKLPGNTDRQLCDAMTAIDTYLAKKQERRWNARLTAKLWARERNNRRLHDLYMDNLFYQREAGRKADLRSSGHYWTEDADGRIQTIRFKRGNKGKGKRQIDVIPNTKYDTARYPYSPIFGRRHNYRGWRVDRDPKLWWRNWKRGYDKYLRFHN